MGHAEVHVSPSDRMSAIRQKVEHWMGNEPTVQQATAHAEPPHPVERYNALGPAALVHCTTPGTCQPPGISQSASATGARSARTSTAVPGQHARRRAALSKHDRPALNQHQGSTRVRQLPRMTKAGVLPSSQEGSAAVGRPVQPRRPSGVPQANTSHSGTGLPAQLLTAAENNNHQHVLATQQLRPQTAAAAAYAYRYSQTWQWPNADRTLAAFW